MVDPRFSKSPEIGRARRMPPPRSAAPLGIEADDSGRLFGRWFRLGLGRSRRRLFLSGGPEPKPEVGGGVRKGRQRRERYREPLLRAAEPERNGEGLGSDREAPKLVLQDDRHLLGILIPEKTRYLDARKPGLETDVEVVLARQTVLDHLLQHTAHGVSQCLLEDGRVVDLVRVHAAQHGRRSGSLSTSRRIERAGRGPRPAPQHPPGGFPAPRPGAVLADRALGVVAARRLEPAADAESSHVRRQGGLVEMNRAKEDARRDLIAG